VRLRSPVLLAAGILLLLAAGALRLLRLRLGDPRT